MPQTDDYSKVTALTAPADAGEAVEFGSPAEDYEFAKVTRSLHVGGAGTVMVIFKTGEDPVPMVCAGGDLLPVRARKIAASGTTATGIVGLY